MIRHPDTGPYAPTRRRSRSWQSVRWRVRGSRRYAIQADHGQSNAAPEARFGDRASGRVGMLTCLGAALLVAGALVALLQRLEGVSGMWVFNLIVALVIATPVVSVAALAGVSLLAVVERRAGRRPAERVVTAVLALAGAGATSGIMIANLRHPLALDGWLGLGGGLLLAIAALAHHRLAGSVQWRPYR
jgi:hypothetical protein